MVFLSLEQTVGKGGATLHHLVIRHSCLLSYVYLNGFELTAFTKLGHSCVYNQAEWSVL